MWCSHTGNSLFTTQQSEIAAKVIRNVFGIRNNLRQIAVIGRQCRPNRCVRHTSLGTVRILAARMTPKYRNQRCMTGMTCYGRARHRRNRLFTAENDKMTPMTGVSQKSKKKRFIEECVVKELRRNPVMPVTPVIATIKYFITTNTITKIEIYFVICENTPVGVTWRST